jgi:hypothetical protein
MKRGKWACFLLLISGTAIVGTGCNRNQGPNPAAYGNLAPIEENAYPPPSQNAYPSGEANRYEPSASVGVQLATAPQPPPPLPKYGQPPCPGPNYIWTPGYWGYGEIGYYWVPGVWIIAPYLDALWTPPWWEFYGGIYRWHQGYWARYIGFYGGINYGFGYTGLGFDGGYWNNGQFYYNRAVANVDPRVTPNVYRYSIANYTPFNRVSYNGGPGGVNRQPTARELAVRPGMRMAPVAEQMRNARAAAMDPRQFASRNHGHPAMARLRGPAAMPNRAPAAAPAERTGDASRMERTPAQRMSGGRPSTFRTERAGIRQGHHPMRVERRAATGGFHREIAPRGHAVERAHAGADMTRAAQRPARAGFHSGGHAFGGGYAARASAFGRGGHGIGRGGPHFGGGGGGHGGRSGAGHGGGGGGHAGGHKG